MRGGESIARQSRMSSRVRKQLRRAAPSIILNVGEGMYSRGRNRQVRYHSALGSARETFSCVEVAEAFGYVDDVDAFRNRFNHIIGTLARLT
jgi:four helix bundle protein